MSRKETGLVLNSIGLPLLLLVSGLVPVKPDELANGKAVNQSGTFGERYASLAVDGNVSTCCIACSSCNSYTPFNVSGWIQIDLGGDYTVFNVTLVNSGFSVDYQYMQNFTISVSPTADLPSSTTDPTICYYYNSSKPVGQSQRISFPCGNPLTGRYVTLYRIGGYRFDALSVCEAYVYGYSGTMNETSSEPGTNKTPSYESTEDGGLSTTALGAIIGAVVGVAVVILGLTVLVVCIRVNRRVRGPGSLTRRQSQKPIMVEDSSSVYAATSSATDSPGRSIVKQNLGSYVAELRATPNSIQKEFKKLPDENAGVTRIGQLPENRLKNRFTNVLPYDHTIVELEIEEFDDESATYINASYLAGYKKTPKVYIAAQGPRPNTIDDFWRMIWQKKVNLIVMLTQLIEKTKNKCELYWPERVDDTRCYHKISVTLASEDYHADYIERRLVIHDERYETESPRTVRQLQYLSWLDNGRPDHCFQLLSFSRRVKTLQNSRTGPTVVHCSSGIGRTGAYIALDYLLDQAAMEEAVSVFACVEELRRQRMSMVQTQDQYEFIYDALVEDIEFGDTSLPCDVFVRKVGDNFDLTMMPILERQLKQLRKVSEPKPNRKSAGVDHENLAKNRNTAIVAYDDSRTYLDGSYVSRSDYINAVSVSSFYTPHAYILTQVPLRDTIVDFWRLIWDYDLKTIVLLDDLTESYPRYWSENSGSRTYGPFLVEMISSQQQSQNVWKRQFVLSNTRDKAKESISVHQFELRNWLKRPSFRSDDVDLLLEMRKQLVDHLEVQTAPERIVIQCMDGSTRSGLFAAALHVIDRILSENKVDVFLSCRYVRVHRPTAVDTMDNYLFLHDLGRICCGQLNADDEGFGLQLKRLSLSTLYASVRSEFSPANSSR